MIFNIFLYISSFVPLYSLILLEMIVDLINKNITFNVLNTILLLFFSILIIIGTSTILFALYSKTNKIQKIEILSANNITDKHFLGYFSIFVLFALSYDLSFISYALDVLLILIFIGIVYIKNSLYYINPLLNILGFAFYDVSYKTESGEIIQEKVFTKNQLKSNEVCYLNTKNDNFMFILTKK